jgi:immune inhibitor A
MYESPQRSGNPVTVIAIVLGVVACLCACIAALGGGAAYLAVTTSNIATQFSTQIPPQLTDVFQKPSATPRPGTATTAPQVVLTPVPTPVAGAQDTLQTLENETIPPSDLRELAMRLKGTGDIPEVVASSPANYKLGQELKFNASNEDTNVTFQVQAKLIYETDNAYFFAQDGVRVDTQAVKSLVDTFQNKIYPTDREFFGSEWTPGVDDDPHLYILYVGGIGQSIAGYFSSADEYSHLAHPYSNEKEMFYVNADNQSPGDPYLLGVLAHEFQHMIHWAHDRNEETWMNEGSSVLAEFLNHYDIGGFDAAYTSNPDLQLTGWSEDPATDPNVSAHYGAGFLFMAYFLDRFGSDATKALVADPANGMRAVDDVLASQGIKDKATGKPLTSVDVFADWTIANYLGNAKVADGRYAYHNYPQAPTVDSPTDTYSTCPTQASATVHQFGAAYYEIDCSGKINISFTGSRQVQVIPTKPYSGRYAFWGHRNDESDTRMTREFDLSGLSKATLTYRAWWELEKDYDFTYLEVSTDGGSNWTILKTPSGTDANSTGNNFGWGYTGNSGGGDAGAWVNETVDLSAYAGRKIQLRFEYVTDAAVNWPGFMVDDISIPELKYSTDFEANDGGWKGEGFVRMDNLLPQEFMVQVITQGAQTTVQRLPLDQSNQGSLDINLAGGDKAVLVVSGITPFTTEVGSFQFAIK